MLYNPPAFRETELGALHAQIAGSGLATLITVGAEGPLVSQLPLLLDASAGPSGTLAGHVARGNPQWRESNFAVPALVLFTGADAYISPSWYPAKQEHGKVVPTWNYSTIYARGRFEIFEDAIELRDQVERLTQKFEGRFDAPWNVSDAPADFIERQLKGIVGVRLRIETIEGKAKLNQNRSAADQDGVISALSHSAAPGDLAVAEAMRARADKPA
jgi:transcriptional regulator